jgi:hypothetical protein
LVWDWLLEERFSGNTVKTHQFKGIESHYQVHKTQSNLVLIRHIHSYLEEFFWLASD